MKTSIGVVIVNWQQPQLTQDTIHSLLSINSSSFNYHIYLVDNGSTDNSAQIFAKRYRRTPQISLLGSAINRGFAGGNNLGIKEALIDKHQYVLLLNNDVTVHQDFLHQLLLSFSQNPKLAMVGPKIYFAPGFEYHRDRYSPGQRGKVIWSAGGYIDWDNVYGKSYGLDEVDHQQYDLPRFDLQFTSGCCLLIKASVFDLFGYLPEQYFMYYEDVDFCYRATKMGFLVGYQPKSLIWHLNSSSTQAGGGALHDYFLTRNRLIFGFTYASLRTKFALFRESLRLLYTGTPWQKNGIVDFYLKRYHRGRWH